MAGSCPKCNTAVEGNAKFCPKCGTLIPEEQSAPKVNPAEIAAGEKPEESKISPEQKPTKEKRSISVGTACASFLLGAKLVPYLLRSLWLMATLNALTTIQYLLTEIAGMAVAFGALYVCAKIFATESRESKSATLERVSLVTGLYFGMDIVGNYAIDKFAADISTHGLIATGVIAGILLIICLYTYNVICSIASAGEKKVSFGAELLGGILLFLAFNMSTIVMTGMILLPFDYGVSFLNYSSLLLLIIFIQSALIHFAVGCGLKKAKSKEKVSSHVHLLRTLVGGGLAVVSLAVLMGEHILPSAKDLCNKDLRTETAKAQLLLGVGDIPTALQYFAGVKEHAGAWKQVANGEKVDYSVKFRGDDILNVLYYVSRPEEIMDKALVDAVEQTNPAWYPFYLSIYHEMEDPDDRQAAAQREAAVLCVATNSFLNVFPTREDIQQAAADITTLCDNCGEYIELYDAYRVMNEVGRGDRTLESCVYDLLDMADAHPDNLNLQLIAMETGVGYLKDDAWHYERVAQVIERIDHMLAENEVTEDIRARFKSLFGDYLSAMNNLEAAEKYYQEAGQQGTNMQEINLKMAVRAFMSNDTEKCYEYTKKAMESGEETPLLLHLNAVSCLKMGNQVDAVRSAGKLADFVKKGGSGDDYLLADLCLFNCVEYFAMADDAYWTDFEYCFYSEEMSEELTVVFAEYPFLDTYCKALYYDKMIRDRDKAQTYADAMVQECPDSAQLWYIRGLAYSDGEKHEEAAKCFEKSLALDNRQLNTRFALANTYDALGRYREAYELTLSIEAEMGAGSEVNHSADVYGLGYHNPRLREALEYKLQEERE